MNVKYICKNKGCRDSAGRTYELSVPAESIMDDKNIATFFCPHCNEKLECEGKGCRPAA